MAKFDLNSYETVEERLKKFWADNPNGRIDTQVVHITDDGSCVTIKAEVFPDAKVVLPVSTGIAQETKGQGGFANADAWMENCETSAIGRALANNDTQGMAKVLVDKNTDQVLGVHILGAHAGEIISQGVTSLEFSSSAEDIGLTSFAHPTLSEAVKEAALATGGHAIHLVNR